MKRVFWLVCDMIFALSLVLIGVGWSMCARAQSPAQPASGLWTTGPAAACPAKSYIWTMSNESNQFRDQAGNVDSERIISRRENGFTTQTVQSVTVPRGTQWDYHFELDGKVEVRNLGTGKAFMLSRCPTSVGNPDNLATHWHYFGSDGNDIAKLSWSSSTDLETDVLDGPFFSCNRRQVHVVYPMSRAKAGQQANLRVDGIERSVSLRGKVDQGPGGLAVDVELPLHHPLYALMTGAGTINFHSDTSSSTTTQTLQNAPAIFQKFIRACNLTS